MGKSFHRSLVLLCAIVFLVGSAQDCLAQDNNSQEFVGTVIDKDSQPISGVQVTIRAWREITTTAEDGSFNVPVRSSGTVEVLFSRGLYRTRKDTVHFPQKDQRPLYTLDVDQPLYVICLLLTFAFGMIASFQSIYENFESEYSVAFKTLPGYVYFAIRGAVPLFTFLLLFETQNIPDALPPLLVALLCGVGAEAFLRTNFYIKKGDDEDILMGGFALLEWYQNFFIKKMGENRADMRKRFVKKNMKNPFLQSYRSAINNLAALDGGGVDIGALRGELDTLKTKYDQEVAGGADQAVMDREYKMLLGYMLLHKVGSKQFKVLIDG